MENWKLVVPGSCKQRPSETLWHLKEGGQVFLEMTQLLQQLAASSAIEQ